MAGVHGSSVAGLARAGYAEKEDPVSILGPLVGNVLPLFFEEAEVARYIVLPESAGGFTLPDPQSQINDLHVQIGAPGLLDDSLPVVFFRTTHTGSPSMAVLLNDRQLTLHTFGDADGGPRSWHELVPAGLLRADLNELTFAVGNEGAPGADTVTFSDVLVLYVSKELTVKKRRRPPVATQ